MSSENWEMIFALLLEPTITEIESNGPNDFFVKKAGVRQRISLQFETDEEYMESIEKYLVPKIKNAPAYNKNSYLFEGSLSYEKNGIPVSGRVHIVLPPAATTAQVTIAKKSNGLNKLSRIAETGSMSPLIHEFLEMSIKSNLNIVFSGGTGSGKTSMLEACLNFCPADERVGVAEDVPELNLDLPNVSYLHSVPWKPGMDSNNVATLSWVVQQFQRMRVDRLVVGETRGREFADFLTAANSGFEGSMTTIHANSPTRCLDKMTTFALKAGENNSLRSINQDIAKAIDLIVQLAVLPDGSHKIMFIQEITDTVSNNEDAKISTNQLFKYDESQKAFVKTANMSDHLREKFASKGTNISSVLSTPIGTINSTFRRGIPIPKERGVL